MKNISYGFLLQTTTGSYCDNAIKNKSQAQPPSHARISCKAQK